MAPRLISGSSSTMYSGVAWLCERLLVSAAGPPGSRIPVALLRLRGSAEAVSGSLRIWLTATSTAPSAARAWRSMTRPFSSMRTVDAVTARSPDSNITEKNSSASTVVST